MENEESIFAAARLLESDHARRAYLDEACHGDAELRATVEALLRAQQQAGSFFERPPISVRPDDETVESNSPQDTAKPGEVSLNLESLADFEPDATPGRLGSLGNYELIELVGKGGMGAVVRAWDTKLQREVALKLMSPELAANSLSAERFLREARAAAAVVHDNVVTIYAIEEDRNPPLLAMEFVEGETLQQKISRDGALPVETIVRLGRQMAKGLAAAHAKGLIHRDIKPANVLLEESTGRAKITDFGLARAADNPELTQDGMILGTPSYMSPEQARGETTNHRSDLFSLGCVLYAMATGKTAFSSLTTIGALHRVCNEEPTPIREINPSIPPWLNTVILRLLQKDLQQRYQTSQEVIEALANAREETPAPVSKKPLRARLKVFATLPFVMTGVVFAAEFFGVTQVFRRSSHEQNGELLTTSGNKKPLSPETLPDKPIPVRPTQSALNSGTLGQFSSALQSGDWTELEREALNHLTDPSSSPTVQSDALAVLALAKNNEAFRRHSKAMLERYAQSTSYKEYHQTGTALVLAPNTSEVLRQGAALLERAHKNAPASWQRKKPAISMSVASYRLGWYSNAVKTAESILTEEGGGWGLKLQCYAVAAMSHHQLGDSGKARAALENALEHLPSIDQVSVFEFRTKWIPGWILLEEAHALLGEPMPYGQAKYREGPLYDLATLDELVVAADSGDWSHLHRAALDRTKPPIKELWKSSGAFAVLLAARDDSNYQQRRDAILAQQLETASYQTALISTLAPLDLEPSNKVVVALERHKDELLERASYGNYYLALALAQYRQGRPTEALKTLQEAWESKGWWPPPEEGFWQFDLFLFPISAMAHHQLGEAGKARECLARADRDLPNPRGVKPDDWVYWICGKVLLDEAHALIETDADRPANAQDINIRLDIDAFDAPAGDTQAGFSRFTSPDAVGDADDSFTPITATVGGVTVSTRGSIAGERFRDRDIDTKRNLPPPPFSHLVRDLIFVPGVGSEIEVLIEGLPAGDFKVTTFHYDRFVGGNSNFFSVFVDDALGTDRLVVDDITFSNLDSFGQSFQVQSDGVSDVTLRIIGSSDPARIKNGVRFNGITIQSVP